LEASINKEGAMFRKVVEDLCEVHAGMAQQVGTVSAQVNQMVDAGSIPVGARLCVGLGVVGAALADLPPAAREEICYRLIGAMLGAESAQGEARADVGAIATERDKPMAA